MKTTKREVFELLNLINDYYGPYEITQEKINEWYRVLKPYPYSQLMENLQKHVEISSFPTRISDLIQKPDTSSRVVPSYEETLVLLENIGKRASEEVIERSLAQIREILGIRRGEI